jgi:hypothetical protein
MCFYIYEHCTNINDSIELLTQGGEYYTEILAQSDGY